MITHIIRPPSILSTPKRLADAISERQNHRVRTRRNLPRLRSGDSILHLFYNDILRRNLQTLGRTQQIRDSSECPFTFFSGSKAQQRKNIGLQEIPTVPCAYDHTDADSLPDYGHGFVVRPLRHSQGLGWRTTNSRRDFHEGREYIQSLVHKRREYRAILCRGQLQLVLRKRTPESNPLAPWNHAQGSSFVTVDATRSNLAGSGILENLTQSHLVRNIDLVGVDIIQDNSGSTFVLEFNSCPSISIQENVNKIAEYFVNNPL